MFSLLAEQTWELSPFVSTFRRADRSDVPVTKGNASARKEGQGDENEPLIPQDGAVPSHVTGTKADCIQDASSLQTQYERFWVSFLFCFLFKRQKDIAFSKTSSNI